MVHSYKSNYKNVEIRQLEKEDIELLRQWRNDPCNTKFLKKIPYITKDNQIEWFENYIQNKDEMSFAIVEKQQLNRTVGSLSLYHFFDKQAEFGKIMVGDIDATGKKIGTNAIIALMLLAFRELELEELYLHVYVNNKIAIRVYQDTGFRVISTRGCGDEEEYRMHIKKEDFMLKEYD